MPAVFGETPPVDPVSPLRAPVPRHPDQTSMFESPVDTTFAVASTSPGRDATMAMSLTIRLHRTERRKCMACGNRRICFYVGLSDLITSPPMCAKCAGIR